MSSCKAVTKLGYKCKNKRLSQSEFCRVHGKVNFNYFTPIKNLFKSSPIVEQSGAPTELLMTKNFLKTAPKASPNITNKKPLWQKQKEKHEKTVQNIIRKNHLTEQIDFLKTLDPRILLGVKAYTSEFYSPINAKLDRSMIKKSGRKIVRGKLNPIEKIIYKCLMYAFINIPSLSESLTVFRSLQLSNFATVQLQSKGFASTTINLLSEKDARFTEEVLNDKRDPMEYKRIFCCRMKIDIPKGQKVLPLLLDLSFNPNEDEILLPPETLFKKVGKKYFFEFTETECPKWIQICPPKTTVKMEIQNFISDQSSSLPNTKQFQLSEDELNTFELYMKKFRGMYDGETLLKDILNSESKLKVIEDFAIKNQIKVNPEHFLKSINFRLKLQKKMIEKQKKMIEKQKKNGNFYPFSL